MSGSSPEEPITTQNVMQHLTAGWNDLQSFLSTLSADQFIAPTDAAGWAIRDHLLHLAVWEAGIIALLQGHSRIAAMGIDAITWESHDDDLINEAIRKHHQQATIHEVQTLLQRTHEQMLQQVATMSDADLARPFRDFQPDSERTEPIVGWIAGNSWGHSAEHLPWMAAIHPATS